MHHFLELALLRRLLEDLSRSDLTTLHGDELRSIPEFSKKCCQLIR